MNMFDPNAPLAQAGYAEEAVANNFEEAKEAGEAGGDDELKA